MRLSQAVNNFITSHGKLGSEDLIRHQFFIYLSTCIFIVTSCWLAILLIFPINFILGPYVLGITVAFSAISLITYRQQGNLYIATNILLSGLHITLTLFCISLLNTYGMYTYYFLGTPILAYFITGSKSGGGWTIATSITLLLYIGFDNFLSTADLGLSNYDVNHAIGVEMRTYLVSMAIYGIGCYLYSYLYYRDRKTLLKHQAKLLYTINHDDLTGAYNYKKISELTGNLIDRNTGRNKRFAYSFINVVDFHYINEKYGYQFGDTLLKELAQTLGEILPEHCYLARVNGTRFTLITLNPESYEDTTAELKAMLTAAWDKVVVGDVTLNIRTKTGTAIYPNDGETLKDITKLADQRMLQD